VYQLPFGDGAFDVVHAHQVLQHLSDPAGALAEMRRVCRARGLVAARDFAPEPPTTDAGPKLGTRTCPRSAAI
jgi:ubiquinone/menaquinone biosynthesis C-methylase UbiE